MKACSQANPRSATQRWRPKPEAVIHAAVGDARRDPALAELPAVDVVV